MYFCFVKRMYYWLGCNLLFMNYFSFCNKYLRFLRMYSGFLRTIMYFEEEFAIF